MEQPDYSTARASSRIQPKLPWLKLHVEMVDDPKMAELTDAEFRLWIDLLCLARMSDVPGEVKMTAKLLAWRLRRPMKKVEQALITFTSLNMVKVKGSSIVLVNFEKRQAIKPSDRPEATRERKQKQRERERNEDHANVTSKSRPVTPVDKMETREDVDETEYEDENEETYDEREEECVNNYNHIEGRAGEGGNAHSSSHSSNFYSTSSPRNGSYSATLTSTPDKFEISEELMDWAIDQGYGEYEDEDLYATLDRATRKMLTHYRANGKKFADWEAQWKLWILGDIEKAKVKREEAIDHALDKPKKVRAEDWEFIYNDELRALMKKLDMSEQDVVEEFDKFRDAKISSGDLRADWDAAFRFWLRRKPEFDERYL